MSGSACLPVARWPRPLCRGPVGKTVCQRMRWQIPSLDVMQPEVQELGLPPPSFLWVSALSGPQCPHHPAHTRLCLADINTHNLQEELTGCSGKLPCPSLCCPNRGHKDKSCKMMCGVAGGGGGLRF